MFSIELDVDKLRHAPQRKYVRGKDGKERCVFELTFAVDDKTNQFGQNVSGWLKQTREEQEAKAKRIYAANGAVFWTNGTASIANKNGGPPKKKAVAKKVEADDDDDWNLDDDEDDNPFGDDGSNPF